MGEKELKVGDAVDWVHTISGKGNYVSMSKVSGYIHEIKDGKARCRRGKKGKVDYWIPLSRVGPNGCDPLRTLVGAIAKGCKELDSL